MEKYGTRQIVQNGKVRNSPRRVGWRGKELTKEERMRGNNSPKSRGWMER